MMNFTCSSFCVLVSGFGCASAAAGENLDLDAREARINYAIGYQVGGDFRRQAVAINPDVLLQGLRDAQGDGATLMTPAEMHDALAGLQRRVGTGKPVQGEVDQIANDHQYLANNMRREGVTTTPSGLQYEVLSAGSGSRPQASDWVTVDYRGTLIDGTVFDSSEANGGPATFRVDSVIPGWTEALQLMQAGAHWRLVVPTRLAYPHSGPLEHKTLIFDLHLLSVDAKQPGAVPDASAKP